MTNKTNTEKRINSFMKDLSFINDVCVNNKFNNEENGFKINEFDEFSGKVWLENNKIFYEFQEKRYFIEQKNNNKCNIYYANLDEKTFDFKKDQKKIDVLIKSGSEKIVEYTLFNIENFKIQLNNQPQEEVERLINQVYNITLKMEDKVGIRNDRVDVRSYDYQKNFYGHELTQLNEKYKSSHGFSDFEFLKQVFLNSGGGFLYDEKKGSFFYHSTKYIEDLTPAQINTFDLKLDNCSHQKFTYLNDEWLQGLKILVNLLRVNNIKIDNPEDVEEISSNLSEAYKYFQEKVKILESKTIPKEEVKISSNKMERPEIMYKLDDVWKVFPGHCCDSQEKMEAYVKELDPENHFFKIVDLKEPQEKNNLVIL